VSDRPGAFAVVPTGAAPRYQKQLVAHLGRKAEVRSEPEGERLVFCAGSCLLTSGADFLRLSATAETSEGLQQVQEVLGRHLERFGQRDALSVSWQTSS
jgi:hypothetical protein